LADVISILRCVTSMILNANMKDVSTEDRVSIRNNYLNAEISLAFTCFSGVAQMAIKLEHKTMLCKLLFLMM